MNEQEQQQFQSLVDWSFQFTHPGVEVSLVVEEMSGTVDIVDREKLISHLAHSYAGQPDKAIAIFNELRHLKVNLSRSTKIVRDFASGVMAFQPLKEVVMPIDEVPVFVLARSSMSAVSWKKGEIRVTHALVDETNRLVLCSLAIFHFDYVCTTTGLAPDSIVETIASLALSAAEGIAISVAHIETINCCTEAVRELYRAHSIDLDQLIKGVAANFFSLVLAHEYGHVLAGHHLGISAFHESLIERPNGPPKRFTYEYEADMIAVLTILRKLEFHKVQPGRVVTFLSILCVVILQLPKETYSEDTGRRFKVPADGYCDAHARAIILMSHFFSENWVNEKEFAEILGVVAQLPAFQKQFVNIWNRTK